MTHLNNPSERPEHPWVVYESRLLMSAHKPYTSADGIRWKLPDVKSVEMHASGRWLIVTPEEGETWWLRINDDIETIEFNPFHHAHVKPELQQADEGAAIARGGDEEGK